MNSKSKVKHLKCLRCGYEWVPHNDGVPARCANVKCRSPYWDRLRRKEAKET